jgi:hypothetical protein
VAASAREVGEDARIVAEARGLFVEIEGRVDQSRS